MVGFFVLEHGSKNRKRPRWGASRLKKSTWQAYRSPASLGEDPLSVPAACGLYEIFHLKCSYCTFIVSNGVAAVKDCFVSEEAVPFFAVDLHEGDDGIFIAMLIGTGGEAKDEFELLVVCGYFFEDEGGVGFAGLKDVIGLGDDLGETGIESLKIAGVAFFDVGDLALGDKVNACEAGREDPLGDDDLVGDDVCGDLAIDGAVDAPDGVNLCHACSLLFA